MKFPNPLSTIQYESRDSYLQANKRLFKIEKQQDNDDDYKTSSSTPIKAIPSTTLSAESGLVDLEKQIGQADSFMLEINEIITEWEANIEQQYAPDARVPYDRKDFEPPDFAPDVDNFGTYDDWLRTAKGIHPFTPSRNRHHGERHIKYDKMIADEKLAHAATINPDYPQEYDDAKIYADDALAVANQDSFDAYNAGLPALEQAHEDAEDANVDADDLNPIFSGVHSRDARKKGFFDRLPPLAQRLLTTIAKSLTIINNIKIDYKSKFSGSKLNRYNNTDMIKIQALLEKFLKICKEVVEKMKNQRRVVLDKEILKKMYINKPDDGIALIGNAPDDVL